MAHDVTDPSGQVWRVKRRWLPWRLRKRDPSEALDVADGGPDVDDLLIGLAIFVVVLVVVVVAPFLIVGAILALELVLLFVLLPLFVLLRVVRVGRWPLEVWHVGERTRLVHGEAVRGWGRSRLRMAQIEDELRLGLPRSWHTDTADGEG